VSDVVTIPVYFDFASTLCYTAHRVMGRLAPQLSATAIALDWRPIDLARITGWRRGVDVVGGRRSHILEVARQLAGPLRMPPRWIDSRPAAAIALALHGTAKEAAWRERVWTAVYEEGRDPDDDGELLAWARDVGLDETAVSDVRLAGVEAETDRAHGLGIDGVPTFLLGPWPMPGIQDDATMLALLRRYVERLRRRSG
jgi:predicted DsbA family dithiol-disulfide isomerase